MRTEMGHEIAEAAHQCSDKAGQRHNDLPSLVLSAVLVSASLQYSSQLTEYRSTAADLQGGQSDAPSRP